MISHRQEPQAQPSEAQTAPNQPFPIALLDQTAITPPKFPISNFQLAQVGNEVILVGSSFRGTPVPNKEEMVIQNEPNLQLILSMSTTKDLANLLTKCVADYETKFGQIPTQPSIRTRASETQA